MHIKNYTKWLNTS